MHWSLLKQFPLFVWLLFAVSSVPNFRPDTGGRRRSLIRVASSVALRGGTALLSLFTLLRLPAALYGVCPALRAVPALGCSTKAQTKSCTCFLCLPRQSGSGSQELDWRTLPGCGAPSALRGPSPSPRPRRVSPRPSQRMSTIQNLRRSLIRNWRPVCSAVGAAVLGAKPASYPSPLPRLRRGWAGP